MRYEILPVLFLLLLAGCIGPPADNNCTTYEDLFPGAKVVPNEQADNYEDAGYECMPYEVNYCQGQCDGGVCPEPGVYSYQCYKP